MNPDPKTEAEVAEMVVRALAALSARDAEAFVALFAEEADVFLFGAGPEEARIGRAAIRVQVEQEFAQSESSSWQLLWRAVSLAGPVALVAGEALARLSAGGGEIDLPHFRFTGVLERCATEWRFVQWHWSLPAGAQANGRASSTPLDEIASAVGRERVDFQDRAAPDGTITLLFSDIEESTPIAERLGDRRWIELLRRHNAIVREQVQVHGGFEVKTIGDAFMVAFAGARSALQCAIGIQRAVARDRLEHPDEPMRVRIGLHSGEPVRDGNDFYGRSVVLASRIASCARGGEILVSSLLRDLIESSGEFHFDEGREVSLKGLSGTQRLYAVRHEEDTEPFPSAPK